MPPKPTSEKPPKPWETDPEVLAWKAEFMRHDPAEGQLLHYEGWGYAGGSTGHLVRRWGGEAWGPLFCVNAAFMRRTMPAGLLVGGVSAPQ